MTPTEFFKHLSSASNLDQVESGLDEFLASDSEIGWIPVGGRENNRGIIELSADPGRALVERITNSVDAVLELEHERHGGKPDCRTPREAASAWLNVPKAGLSELSTQERRSLAQRNVVRVQDGEDKASRIVEIRDYGIGIDANEMRNTILSLNESNKIQKYYLAGTYGQGGSSTFAVSKYTLIASRRRDDASVAFSLVKFLDLPAEIYKTGHYVYLSRRELPLEAEVSTSDFPRGKQVKHFGFDLSDYSSPLGPNSVYGLLNQILFDPILPIWLDNQPLNNQRRVIKGARNSLNGAVDEGDEQRGSSRISYVLPMFYASLGELGRLGMEYWVLDRSTPENKRPTASFVNPSKPILLTLYGQNHAEISSLLIRKNAALPFLAGRLICHINCDGLSPSSKRALFVSTREEARHGAVYNLIEQELVKVLSSDDTLKRLNDEARLADYHERDEDTIRHMRQEVSRLLRLQGVDIVESTGGIAAEGGGSIGRISTARMPHRSPKPIELHDPPTFIKIVQEDQQISFYSEQRRYIRIETDAYGTYHNPDNPNLSRINIVSTHRNVTVKGSTPLKDGRMRVILECSPDAEIGSTGMFKIELSSPGRPMISDEREILIVAAPPVKPDTRKTALPDFEIRPVNGKEDSHWLDLEWPDNVLDIASSTEMENDKIVIYYSKIYPPFANQLQDIERRDPKLGISFVKRYEIWLAVHALMLQRDQEKPQSQQKLDEELEATRERQERCRAATLASFFARNEILPTEVARLAES